MGLADQWTSTEDALLTEKYSHDKDWEEIAKFFPNRSEKGVRQRAVNRGLTRGRRDERHFRNLVSSPLKIIVPEHVLMDRDRRSEARANQSLTAQLMGDPV